jgi:DNA-binding XRE family transcriptional regulator
MFVYVMRSELNLVKIGISSSPEKRRDSLKSASGLMVEIVHAIKSDNAKAIEVKSHSELQKHRKTGEWFDVDVDIAVSTVDRISSSLMSTPTKILSPGCIGSIIKDRRNALRLTQGKLAETLGYSRVYVGQVERGKETVRVDMLFQIFDSLGITISASFKQ